MCIYILIRIASQYSRAANDAYREGDYISGHPYSLMAWEAQFTANCLIAKAAIEIFKSVNSTDDLWKLDLHGLHAMKPFEHKLNYRGRGQNDSSICQIVEIHSFWPIYNL